MQCESGNGRAFAGLAGAVEDDLSFGGEQKLPLPGIAGVSLGREDQRWVKGQCEGLLSVHDPSMNAGCEFRREEYSGRERAGCRWRHGLGECTLADLWTTCVVAWGRRVMVE